MLYELYVENIALIRNMRLPLGAGMNALTGETGAGKSLVVDAVSLLIGGRGNDGFIRSDCERALVEGTFLPPFPSQLEEVMEAAELEDTLILSRELIRGGRSVARINGRTVTLARLKEVGRLLINIHGQQEHTLLLEESRQLVMLDGFGGAHCLQLLAEVGQAYAAMQAAKQQVAEYETQQDERERSMQELQESIQEITAAAVREGEMEALREEANLLMHGEQLHHLATTAHHALYDGAGAVERVNEALAILQQAADLDAGLQPLAERLSNLYYELEDVANETASYRNRLNLDAYRLEEVEARLALLRRLCKRYGQDEAGLLQALAAAQQEYSRLEEIASSGDLFYQQAAAMTQAYQEKSALLSQARQQAATQLAAAVTAELHLLAMPQAQFRVDLPACADSAKGNERAIFMICPNLGEPFEAVSKTASGGELSRILLGIKVILSQLDAVPTIVFDEIDTGMSGRALVSVAERLAIVGSTAQTIVVSHAAVVAAAAHNHIYIEKHEEEGRTVAACHTLDEQARVQELARLIAGDKAGETTMRQAKEMLQQMQAQKA